MRSESCDVVVAGGGLAGLTLALQARRNWPEWNIIVVDCLERPMPTAAFKVGESTIEGGAHYLSEILGLNENLQGAQLCKNALRFFLGGGSLPFELRPEIGPPCYSAYPTYQIDRGVLENDLRALACAEGVRLIEGAQITDVFASAAERALVCRDRSGVLHRIQARWLIDASGRRQLLQSRLGLRRANGHRVNSAWFRLPGRIDVNDFSESAAWQARDPERHRYYSTNHLVGAGYWIWLIPLVSGCTSIGITTDEDLAPAREFRNYDSALLWIKRTEPALFARINSIEPLDYRTLRNISYTTERVFSAEGWVCAGVAGLFQDPLYSLGIDFIGIVNLLTLDLFRRESAGEDLSEAVRHANELALLLDEIALGFSKRNYPVFGKSPVLLTKLYWDALLYWVAIAPFLFYPLHAHAGRILATGLLQEYAALQRDMQAFFRTWAAEASEETQARYYNMPPPGTLLTEAHGELRKGRDVDSAIAVLREYLEAARELSVAIKRRACEAGAQERNSVASIHDLDLSFYHGELDATRVQLMRNLLRFQAKRTPE